MSGDVSIASGTSLCSAAWQISIRVVLWLLGRLNSRISFDPTPTSLINGGLPLGLVSVFRCSSFSSRCLLRDFPLAGNFGGAIGVVGVVVVIGGVTSHVLDCRLISAGFSGVWASEFVAASISLEIWASTLVWRSSFVRSIVSVSVLMSFSRLF